VIANRITETCLEVTADSKRNRSDWPQNEYYFPEYFVSNWFRKELKREVPVYTLERTGVKTLLGDYTALVEKFNLDTIIVVDGGTDSLMRGDESGLGTPTEDMMTIAAVNLVKQVKTKLLLCLGMGIDCHHGVCHSHFLENVAALSENGGYLGCFALMPQMEEAQLFKSALVASQPGNSIVSTSVLSAVEGKFGNYHSQYSADRTSGSKLYISPLMNLYWAFNLQKVAERVLYLDRLSETTTMTEIRSIIHKFCDKYYSKGKYVGPRKQESIPY